ncbi:hypothetical protein [Dethiosulfatarculus sandiegensis]|uniref:Outer membrane protein beta-barrel domain-containing protein n=1 Tax=Dethiosulfatarculus sandiegensis TaxID=1429043 RepID=A0A0D2GEW7_9BACT|nr:hypothetical protein [Dethiosulfatarculus sandiegensis]KIX13467.1 hypothetical protein X474_13360 [Dethiosulfatarculus sandiegensis]
MTRSWVTRKIRFSVFIISLFSLVSIQAGSAFAEKLPDSLLPNFELGVGYQLTHMKYTESGIEEKGFLNGLYLNATWHTPTYGMMLKLEGEVGVGTIDYDGETWGGTPVSSSGDNQLLNLRFALGKDLDISPTAAITPYLGLALRYWNDKQDGSGGYERETTYYYLPIGIELNIKPQDNMRLTFTAEYDFFLSGKNKSHLSDVSPGFNDVDLDQNSGMGFRLAARLVWDMQTIAFTAEPFFRYWDIDESDRALLTFWGQPVSNVVEPDNDTKIFGLRLGVLF